MGSIIGFQPVCNAELILGRGVRTGGQCCIPATSRETGLCCQARIAASRAATRRRYTSRPKLDRRGDDHSASIQTAPARAIDPNACCSQRGGSCRLRQETCGGAAPGGQSKQWRLLAPAQTLGSRGPGPGGSGQARSPLREPARRARI